MISTITVEIANIFTKILNFSILTIFTDFCPFSGETATTPTGRRKRPEGGREDAKPTISSSTGRASPSTTSGAPRFGQTQQPGGLGPNRRRVPNSKPTNRPQRSGT